jgi:hypothetical protein
MDSRRDFAPHLFTYCLGLVFVATSTTCTSRAQETPAGNGNGYVSAEEAYSIGAARYNARNFKASREPFEAALALAPDDKFRVKVYEALLAPYREIPEFEPFQNAAEFIITHATYDAQRSLTRRAFLSFAYNRGQIDSLIKRYESRLAGDRKDFLAVYLLSEIYSTTNSNPERAIELLKQLQQMNQANKAGTKEEAPSSTIEGVKIAREKANLARQYVQAKKFKEAAELYEEVAPLDPTTHAWNLKEAASAWLKAGDKKKSLQVARKANETPPEARNEQLTHFYHRNLGDIFVALAKPAEAVPHYEIALKTTKIEGYLKDTQASLEDARRKSK